MLEDPTASHEPARPDFAWQALAAHFDGLSTFDLVSSRRQFADHSRADLQTAINEAVSAWRPTLYGIFQEHIFYKMGLANLLVRDPRRAVTVTPPQYQDVDVGESVPVPCLGAGLWLARPDGIPLAIFVSAFGERRRGYVIVEVTTPPEAKAQLIARRFLEGLRAALEASRYYRGKVLSFEQQSDFVGTVGGLLVHRLPQVARDAVILDATTMRKLDDNIFAFDHYRAGLKALGQSTRKGILLHGAPGTGKTHVIRWVVSNLPTHTTVLITADQVGDLARYLDLARTLQPSIVVIEDVDLIGRARESLDGPKVESLLNMLLNEMDGLREDADILFILTTNRPEQIEAALASRPGRIDQAIEIPLPDTDCRRRLIALYGHMLAFDPEAERSAVEGSAGVSAAFIKEMVRRMAQLGLGREPPGGAVTLADVQATLDDMLVSGGAMGRRLLGAALSDPVA